MEHLTRRRFLQLSAIGATGAATAAAVGCGGDDDDDDDAPTMAPTATAVPTQAPPASSTTVPTEDQGPAESPTTPAGPAALTWQQLGSADAPEPRRDHAIAPASPTANALFLHGGRAGSTFGDLWHYDLEGESWTLVETQGPQPPNRFGHNMLLDEATGDLLLFGGQDGPAFFNDLWAFTPETATWRELSPGSAPEARYGAAAGYDPAAGNLIVSHGFTGSGRFDDTWTYSAEPGDWADRTPSGDLPVERCLVRGAWDTSRDQFILFGGQSNVAAFHNDTWLLDLDQGWTEVTGLLPPPRNLYGGTYDRSRGQFLVVGGRGEDGPLADAWAFDSATASWAELPLADGPEPRSGHDLVYLPGPSVSVLVGGRADDHLMDVWLLS